MMNKEIIRLHDLLRGVIKQCEEANYYRADIILQEYDRQFWVAKIKMSIGLRRLYEDCANTASFMIGDHLANRMTGDLFEYSRKFRHIPDPRL